jgi:hypothetical protein
MGHGVCASASIVTSKAIHRRKCGSVEDGASYGVGQMLLFLVFVAGMQGSSTGERSGRFDRFRQIVVAVETDGDADLCLSASSLRASGCERILAGKRGTDHAQNASATTDRHAVAECDFGGHAESEFDLRALVQRRIGEKEHSAGAEILSESHAIGASCRLMERKREEIREPLSDAPFNPNWRSGHRGITSFAGVAGEEQRIL